MQNPPFHQYYLTQLLDQQKFKSTYLAYPQGDVKLKVVVKIFDEECLIPNHDYAKSLTAMKGFLALDHPHIVPVLNMDIENRQPYIVTRYMSHGSLRQRVDSSSPKLMHWTAAVNIVIQIAQALMYAHERHIIHGNIKPNNIFFDRAGEVLVTDFRLPHFIDISKLNYKTDLQTISYMAPEQFMGKSPPASDQYALACLAYELLTGHAPFFDAQNFSLLWQKHATVLPPPLTAQVPELPMAIESAILKAMSKKPEMRYPDIAMFAYALECELPASAVRKGRMTLPSELELEFPRPFSPPLQKEARTTIQLPALTGEVPLPKEAHAVKKSALTGTVPIPVMQGSVSEEKRASGVSTALIVKKNSHFDKKDAEAPTLALSAPSGRALRETRIAQKVQQKRLAMRSALLTSWRKRHFKPSKRFVIQTLALVGIVLLSTGLFVINNLSVDTHTKQALVGATITPMPNVTAGASATSGTAGGTGTQATIPGVSGVPGGNGGNGGNGGTSPPATTIVTPVVSVTQTPPTPTNTAVPIVSLNRAQHASVSVSSSVEGSGWSKAYINDDKTISTPSSMGWSTAGDFVINHTEWITFDFGSALTVGRVDLFPRSDSGNVGQGFPIDFSIQLSFDDENWRSVVTQANYPLPRSAENQVFFFPAQSTRYLMVQATTLRQIPNEFNRYRMQFSEICIY